MTHLPLYFSLIIYQKTHENFVFVLVFAENSAINISFFVQNIGIKLYNTMTLVSKIKELLPCSSKNCQIVASILCNLRFREIFFFIERN